MARQTAYYACRVRPAGFYRRLDDETVVQQIRAVTNSRVTYGYRRVWAMVNRTFRASYNRERIRRLMRMHSLMLPPRVHRRHLGQVQQLASNQRWCSDIFLIPCWSGEVLSVAFAIDCHDREVFAWARDPVALRQWSPVHRDGLSALRPRAWPGPHHDTGVQPGEQRLGRGLRAHMQA